MLTMLYLAILLFLMILSFHYDICGRTKYKSRWYGIVLLVFILFAGLRWRVGIDTMRYLYSFYHDYPSLSKFSFKEYGLGKDPLFVLINSFVRSIGGRFYVVQLIQATFVNILILNYFKRHSKYIFTCCLFYYLLSYVSFTMEIMRASFSIVISLYAFDYFIEKKWLKGYLLLMIAAMFHAQTLVLFIVPAFLSLRLNKKGLLILVGVYILGIFLQDIVANYIPLFDGNDAIARKMSSYTSETSSYGRNTNNINYYIFNLVPKIIYPLFAIWHTKRNQHDETEADLMRLEPFVLLGVAFVLIQIHFIIAYRYVEYFTIYFAIYYAETCVGMVANRRKIRIDMSYLKTMIIFFPIMLSLVYFITFKSPRYIYSSVLNRTIIKKKEAQFRDYSIRDNSYSFPDYNEY